MSRATAAVEHTRLVIIPNGNQHALALLARHLSFYHSRSQLRIATDHKDFYLEEPATGRQNERLQQGVFPPVSGSSCTPQQININLLYVEKTKLASAVTAHLLTKNKTCAS